MNDMLEKIKNNKKILVVVSLLVLVIALVIIIIVVGKNKKPTIEEQLNSAMKTMAKDFYPNLEQGDESKRTNFLMKYKDIGVKVNFDNLSRYNAEERKSEIELLDKYKCNKENTKATIKPRESYGKEDYDIEITLECELN